MRSCLQLRPSRFLWRIERQTIRGVGPLNLGPETMSRALYASDQES